MTGPLDRLAADLRDTDRPTAVALMHLLMEAPTEAEARAALGAAMAGQTGAADRSTVEHLKAVEALWSAHPGAWRTVRTVIDGIAHERRDATPEGTLRYWAAAFDRLVAAAPEASVALYSLGSADLLDAATDEVVDRMAEWGLLGPAVDALDLGCGIGRFAAALASRVGSVLGLDISRGMIEEARRRHGAVPNLRLAVSSGQDLAMLPAAGLDLILAADVFPYLVQAGGSLADRHVAEIGRVLRVGGGALILNFSYRGAIEQDRREVAAAAGRAGLAVERDGTRDLRSWDAATFLLRR